MITSPRRRSTCCYFYGPASETEQKKKKKQWSGGDLMEPDLHPPVKRVKSSQPVAGVLRVETVGRSLLDCFRPSAKEKAGSAVDGLATGTYPAVRVESYSSETIRFGNPTRGLDGAEKAPPSGHLRTSFKRRCPGLPIWTRVRGIGFLTNTDFRAHRRVGRTASLAAAGCNGRRARCLGLVVGVVGICRGLGGV